MWSVTVSDITKNVLKEHAKSFNEIFDHAKKNLNKVYKYILWRALFLSEYHWIQSDLFWLRAVTANFLWRFAFPHQLRIDN